MVLRLYLIRHRRAYTLRLPYIFILVDIIMSEAELLENERSAVRAYLARAEVRLSTLHRIATAYISGAGLLLLVPIFLRDVVEGLLLIYIELFASLPFANHLPNALLFVLLTYPFILSLAIPLYGVYLMLKDIIHFYFTIYAPGFSPSLLNPTFSLNSLMLSPDDAPQTKRAVQALQYHREAIEYMIPFSDRRRERYFDILVAHTKGEIIPPTRRNLTVEDASEKDVRHMNTAFGIARGLDRSLIEEVALMEATLTRNILYLRRLMLRYVKTLLMFLWTAVISFVALPFLQASYLPRLWILAVVYLVWAVAAIRIVRWPVLWIYRHRSGVVDTTHVDVQLNRMERRIKPFLWASIAMSVLTIGLLILAHA